MVCSQTFKATQIVITEIRLILNLEMKGSGLPRPSIGTARRVGVNTRARTMAIRTKWDMTVMTRRSLKCQE